MKFVFKFDKLKKKRCDIKKIKIRDMKHSKKKITLSMQSKSKRVFLSVKNNKLVCHYTT